MAQNLTHVHRIIDSLRLKSSSPTINWFMPMLDMGSHVFSTESCDARELNGSAAAAQLAIRHSLCVFGCVEIDLVSVFIY